MTPLRLWNTLSKTYAEVQPAHPDSMVRVYHCGPTVYASPHIGNIRRFLIADLLTRTLQALGYSVRSVMNITDVGHLLDAEHAAAGTDRMLLAASREQVSPEEIAAKYTQEFFEALTMLRAEPAQYYPRATMHIPQMIDLIQRLITRGAAYETASGVYVDVTKVPRYGALSGNTLEALAEGARVAVREEKRHPADFAVWIKAPKEHLMQWDSPWGRGYPGWHIECSTMAMHALGETIDIHTGGEDNIFPHHENEIAQSEGATGKPFAHIWVHNAHLLVNNKKMSKSEGSFITLRDMLERGVDPRAFRLLTLQTHYRSKLNFTWESLESASEALKSMDAFVRELQRIDRHEKTHGSSPESAWNEKETRDTFLNALANDLGSPQALAVLFQVMRTWNPSLMEGSISPNTAERILTFFRFADQVLAIMDVSETTNDTIPDTVQRIVEEREHARHTKDFPRSDRLRSEIQTAGFDIEDTPQGPRLTSRKKA